MSELLRCWQHQATILAGCRIFKWESSYSDGLVQDCSNSSANALELLQSYTKPSICFCHRFVGILAENLRSIDVWWSVCLDEEVSTSHGCVLAATGQEKLCVFEWRLNGFSLLSTGCWKMWSNLKQISGTRNSGLVSWNIYWYCWHWQITAVYKKYELIFFVHGYISLWFCWHEVP